MSESHNREKHTRGSQWDHKNLRPSWISTQHTSQVIFWGWPTAHDIQVGDKQYELGNERGADGNLFMNIPNHPSLQEIISLTQDREGWKRMMESHIPEDKQEPLAKNKTDRWVDNDLNTVWVSHVPDVSIRVIPHTQICINHPNHNTLHEHTYP